MAGAFIACFQAHAAEPSTRSREVDELIHEADAAVRDLDIDRARALWAQVHALEPSTMALCQLGQLDRRLGRLEEAATELSQCVEQMRAPTNDVERRRYEVRRADLAAVRQRVATIHLHPPPDTAQIFLDGKEVKAGSPIYIVPGQHEVMVRGQRGQLSHRLVKVAAGESRDVALSFDHSPGAAAPAASRVAPAPAPVVQLEPIPVRSGPVPWIVGTGVAASATLLLAGVGFHLGANSADDDVATATDQIADERLFPSSPRYKQLLDDATSANDRANVLRGVGTGMLIAGAVAGAATLVYVVLPHNAEIRARTAGAEVKIAW